MTAKPKNLTVNLTRFTLKLPNSTDLTGVFHIDSFDFL